MVGMRQKLKDVELAPYMLAIYKDNEHRHLLKHALECWEHRKRMTPVTTGVSGILTTNPIHYCSFPPLEMIEKYDINPITFLSSRTLQCPKVARWAFETVLDGWVGADAEHMKLVLGQAQPYLFRILSLIAYDEDLTYKIIYSGLASYMPAKFQFGLTEDQKLAATFCA